MCPRLLEHPAFWQLNMRKTFIINRCLRLEPNRRGDCWLRNSYIGIQNIVFQETKTFD